MSDAPLNNRDLERVIARAMEIDALGRPQTREALHKVAAQLNIAPSAIDQALAEVLQGEATVGGTRIATDAAVAERSGSKIHPWLTAACVSIGVAAGLLAGSLYVRGNDDQTIITIMMLLGVSAGLAWIHRDDRKPLAMVARMAVLWSSFGYAWAIGHGELLSWFADTTASVGGASVLTGAAFHMVRKAWLRLRARSGTPTSPPRKMRDVFTPVPGPYHTPV